MRELFKLITGSTFLPLFRKYLCATILLFAETPCFSQPEEIYRLTFADPSNFRITTSLDHKQPSRIIIIDTTKTWLTKRFWLGELNRKTKRRLERDEHHPYNHTYIFKDTLLDRLVTDTEKKELSLLAGGSKSKRINLRADNYETVPASIKITGFYFVTTEPVFSSIGNYAFIDLTVFYRENDSQELNATYFGTVCIVYRKDSGEWNKISVIDHLIL